ncbi:MAG: RodZ domain-containing protein [Chloroflexota bacterium]
MTTRDEARRGTADLRDDPGRPDPGREPGRDYGRDPGDASRSSSGLADTPPLPERLYAARERKGVDLYRAERDTKIRARYLAALERGDYRELPGAVYTKGFLRNYALYLGLEPEEILDQWRRERGDGGPAQPVISVPKPIHPPRRGLTFSPGVVVAALVTVMVVAVGAYLTVQVMRFNKPPTLAVTEPNVATTSVDQDTDSYTLRGTTIPNGTVTIEVSGTPTRTTADSAGSWSLPVDLRRGKNQFKIWATDPDTGKQSEETAQVVIMVPFAEIEVPTLTVDQPTDGATFENGAIPVQGMTTNATSVSVGASYDGPPDGAPAAAPGAARPPAPPPATVAVAEDGSFTTPLQLTAGRWSITVTASGAANRTTSITRHVAVAYKGVNLVVEIKGGPAWLKVWVDGKLASDWAGVTAKKGKVISFTANSSVEVRTGSSGATNFTLNGQSLGPLGRRGTPETWLFKPPDPPKKTQHQ